MAGAAHATPVYDREALTPGAVIDGPAIIREAVATTIVEPGWRASMSDRADLVLAGCAILEALMRLWPCERLRVADRGLREGMLTTMMAEDGFRDMQRNRRRRRPSRQTSSLGE